MQDAMLVFREIENGQVIYEIRQQVKLKEIIALRRELTK